MRENSIPFQIEVDPELRAALEELYHKKLLLQQVRAQKEQELVAKEFREARAIDGIGAHTMQIHADAYHQIAQDMGGYEIWQQKDFVKHFLKRAPECRVDCKGTRIQSGYGGLSAGATRKRFSKTY